jgi:hypothetical protein
MRLYLQATVTKHRLFIAGQAFQKVVKIELDRPNFTVLDESPDCCPLASGLMQLRPGTFERVNAALNELNRLILVQLIEGSIKFHPMIHEQLGMDSNKQVNEGLPLQV